MYQNGKLIDRRELLKIKLASLVLESKLIRLAEERQKAFSKRAVIVEPILLHEMILHRRGTVRKQSRLTGIALAMIRGRVLEQLEPLHKPDNLLTESDWNAITKMVVTYGSQEAVAHTASERARYARWLTDEKAAKTLMPAY